MPTGGNENANIFLGPFPPTHFPFRGRGANQTFLLLLHRNPFCIHHQSRVQLYSLPPSPFFKQVKRERERDEARIVISSQMLQFILDTAPHSPGPYNPTAERQIPLLTPNRTNRCCWGALLGLPRCGRHRSPSNRL